MKAAAQRLVLLAASILFTWAVIEAGYRLLDPFPYIPPSEFNKTEHGNLSQYDPLLGWKGVPGGRAEFVTMNRRVLLVHNRQGFRDVEHDPADATQPAIVFLGDSFTWGYEVTWDEMFVNLVREKLPDREVFNLSHRGYGTDQEMLVFDEWRYAGRVEKVVLMFDDNDVDDNNSEARYDKPKPRYVLGAGGLELTGVPVPKQLTWLTGPPPGGAGAPVQGPLERLLLRSHFLHDVHFRYSLWRTPPVVHMTPFAELDLSVTGAILAELNRRVEARGANLMVVLIPSAVEIDELNDWPPYQDRIAELCSKLGIEHVDLAPAFKGTWLRTYYRTGGHWNPRGHRVAAEAILERLRRSPR